MSDHRFLPTSQMCLGCAASAKEVRDGKEPAECPAEYFEIGSTKRLVIITALEELNIRAGEGYMLNLLQSEMFDLRDAIDEGVRKIRERAR